MNYFKVIQDDKVVDAGFSFIKENKNGIQLYCEPDEAELVQSYNELKYYHTYWLLSVKTYPDYEEADVVMIGETEYNDIIAYLDDGEEVPIEPEKPDPEPEPKPEPEPEDKPMTIAEMREKITEQENTITMLTECILEMSEIVYSGEGE